MYILKWSWGFLREDKPNTGRKYLQATGIEQGIESRNVSDVQQFKNKQIPSNPVVKWVKSTLEKTQRQRQALERMTSLSSQEKAQRDVITCLSG